MTVSDQLFFVDAFIGTKYEDQNCCRLEIAILKGSYHFICDAGLWFARWLPPWREPI